MRSSLGKSSAFTNPLAADLGSSSLRLSDLYFFEYFSKSFCVITTSVFTPILLGTSAVWDITLDIVSGDGFVTSGKITYRVNEATIEERDGLSMVAMKAYNETLNLPVLIIASTIEGKFKLGIYVEAHKKVYYFYE